MFSRLPPSIDNGGLAQRALQFLLEPVVDALGVELVRARQGLDHLPGLQHIYANRAVRLVLLADSP